MNKHSPPPPNIDVFKLRCGAIAARWRAGDIEGMAEAAADMQNVAVALGIDPGAAQVVMVESLAPQNGSPSAETRTAMASRLTKN